MILNIKILMIFFILSFVYILYKLNKFSRVILIETSDRVLENVEIDERHRQPSPVLVNYFSDLLNKRPNLLTFPLLMTTSFIYNKKECINEESYELDHIKQTIELKKLSMSIALLVFLIIGIEWNNLDVFSSAYQKGFSITLPLGINSGIILGYDHLSIPFILLLSFVFPVVFMSNWTTVKLGEMKYYLTTILASHYFLIIVFLVIDILMFYISFEIILPFFFILLGMFGGVQKFRAMYYLFLYTLWGSLFMLLEFLTKIGENGTGVMGLLEDLQLSSSWGILGSIGIILAFSIKTPIVPFHLWLPLAHGDANVSGSIVLASIVLKMALYGFIRILIFILLLAFSSAQLTMFSIFIFSLIFASTTTMRQNDLKVLVAYSSVAHMGSTLLGGFSNNQFGIFGSILFSIAHGVVSPALFIFVGAVFYDRIGSRIMNYLKGLVVLYPLGSLLLLPFVFGNMGTPLTANFIAEFQCLLATFSVNILMGIIAGLSIVLSAIYSISMYNRIITGSLSTYLATAPDTSKKETFMIIALMLFMVLFGIYPSLLSNSIDLGLSNILLSGGNNILNLSIIISLILNIQFILIIFETIKQFISYIIFKFKYLFISKKKEEGNDIILAGNCCSKSPKEDDEGDEPLQPADSRENEIIDDRQSNLNRTTEGPNDTAGVNQGPIDAAQRVDTSDPNTRHLAQGQPPETSALDQFRSGGTDNSLPATQGNAQGNNNSSDVGNSQVTGDSRREDEVFEIEGNFLSPEELLESVRRETSNLDNRASDIGGDTSNPITDVPVIIVTNESSNANNPVNQRIGDNSGTSSELNQDTNSLVYTTDTRGELVYNDFQYFHLNPLTDAFNKTLENFKNPLDYMYGKFSDIFSKIEFNICIPDLPLDNIIYIGCDTLLLISILYMVNLVVKYQVKLNLENLNKSNEYNTKIKLLNLNFVKIDSCIPDFIRSGAPSPETRPVTAGNQANGNGNESSSEKDDSGNDITRPSSGKNESNDNGEGSSGRGESNGSNNGRPSRGEGSSSGRPWDNNDPEDNNEGSSAIGRGSNIGGPSEGNANLYEGEGIPNNELLNQETHADLGPEAQPTTNDVIDTGDVPLRRTGPTRKNLPREDINKPVEFKEYKNMIKERIIRGNDHPDTPPTPQNTPETPRAEPG
jgi:NADH-ubiquinone oxidoreductase chain 4